MTLSLAGLDMSVLLPAWLPSDQVEFVGTGKDLVRWSGPEYWEDVSLAPVGAADGPPAWIVRTLARRECRPGGEGGWTIDPPLHRAAATPVIDLLLQQIPYGLPMDETRQRVHEASDTADAAAERRAHLDDGSLLEGTGQNMRKMTVRTVEALADPRLVPLLQAAHRERLTALGRA